MKILDISSDLERLVNQEFESLHSGGGRSSIQGGQSAADQALGDLDISGYAKKRCIAIYLMVRGPLTY